MINAVPGRRTSFSANRDAVLPDRDCQAPPGCGLPVRCAYFLDLDATLVEIAHRPAVGDVDVGLSALIQYLNVATSGALALISERPIADIDRMFKRTYLPVAGQHGAERRDAFGEVHVSAVDLEALATVRRQVLAWCADYPGLDIEEKGLSIALRFCAASELAHMLNRLLHTELDNLQADLQVQPGKMVLEIKPSGWNKGRAIEDFLQEAPFADRLPVFIGDDVSDESGFATVNMLGGASIKVGAGASCARWRLPSMTAVHRWLRER